MLLRRPPLPPPTLLHPPPLLLLLLFLPIIIVLNLLPPLRQVSTSAPSSPPRRPAASAARTTVAFAATPRSVRVGRHFRHRCLGRPPRAEAGSAPDDSVAENIRDDIIGSRRGQRTAGRQIAEGWHNFFREHSDRRTTTANEEQHRGLDSRIVCALDGISDLYDEINIAIGTPEMEKMFRKSEITPTNELVDWTFRLERDVRDIARDAKFLLKEYLRTTVLGELDDRTAMVAMKEKDKLEFLAGKVKGMQRVLRHYRMGHVKRFHPRSDESAYAINFQNKELKVAVGDSTSRSILDALEQPGLFVEFADQHNIVFGVDATKISKRGKSQLSLNLSPFQTERWMACYRQKLWWMTTTVGGATDRIPRETQFLLGKFTTQSKGKDEDGYILLLPLVDQVFRTSIYSNQQRKLQLRLESGDPLLLASQIPSSLYVAAGKDPYKLVARGVKFVSNYLGTFECRDRKSAPPNIDLFGWCTWDAFYSKVNRLGIGSGLDAFSNEMTPVKFLILDDGWQNAQNDEKWRIPQEADVREEEDVSEMVNGGVVSAETWGDKSGSQSSVLAKLVTWFYEKRVNRARFKSLSVRLWRWLAQGVMREKLISYFAEATDWMKRLVDIKANRKFNPLGEFAKDLKEQHGLDYIYCWHALLGYWLGVDPTAKGMKQFMPRIIYPYSSGLIPNILWVEPSLAWSPPTFVGVGMVSRKKADEFYEDLHSYLSICGVNGVKVDVQAAATTLGAKHGGGASLTRKMVHSMENSVRNNLNNSIIGCMAHPTENIYSFRSTPVARTSDDFYPNDQHSHQQHITTNAFNSLFLGEIVTPDWDCFHTKHPFNELHATARAVGGCPIYTSDRVGNSDYDLLRKLVLPDGRVYRAQLPGRPTRDSLFENVMGDAKTVLKVWNKNLVNGVVGAFNVQGWSWDRDLHGFRNNFSPDIPAPTLKTSIKASDVEDLKSPTGRFALYSHKFQRLHIASAGEEEGMELELAPTEADAVLVAPVFSFAKELQEQNFQWHRTEDILFAPLGNLQMLNGGGAISGVSKAYQNGEKIAYISIIGRQFLSFWCTKPPRIVRFQGYERSEENPDYNGVKLSFECMPVETGKNDYICRIDLSSFARTAVGSSNLRVQISEHKRRNSS
eukprot:CAMPEP_0114512736 /NCGR_PEP_ID=MMETSP0109-20121206/15153_1 /TAXON_ID=29199 /ORGANISM="Chlorarachnion reptans, Strain CCCM449" /LENGTH=1127 /DNA_ID=CAMNT_0001692477 /DNA_START=398 /DNA_END=3778 /DNA_ORIENTATION=+